MAGRNFELKTKRIKCLINYGVEVRSVNSGRAIDVIVREGSCKDAVYFQLSDNKSGSKTNGYHYLKSRGETNLIGSILRPRDSRGSRGSLVDRDGFYSFEIDYNPKNVIISEVKKY